MTTVAKLLKKYRYFFTGLSIVFAFQTFQHFMYGAEYTWKPYLIVLVVAFATLGVDKVANGKNNG